MHPKLSIIGIGTGGTAFLNSSIFPTKGIEAHFIAMNTDHSYLDVVGYGIDKLDKLILGYEKLHGLGTGSNPIFGEAAARESSSDIRKILLSSDVVVMVAGLGGGTGTGVSYVVGEICKEMNILCVSLVSLPFSLEGTERRYVAITGLKRLREVVDIVICVSPEHCVEDPQSYLTSCENLDNLFANIVVGINKLISGTKIWEKLNLDGLKKTLQQIYNCY